MNDLEFLKKYEQLLDKDYCNCNEMNCIDNNSPRRILNIAKNQQKEIERLTKCLEEIDYTIYSLRFIQFYDKSSYIEILSDILKVIRLISQLKDLEKVNKLKENNNEKR